MIPQLRNSTLTIDAPMRYSAVPIHCISLPNNYCGMDMDQVGEYMRLLYLGYTLEPVILFDDKANKRHWLIDGRHRFVAHVAVGRTEINAGVTDTATLVPRETNSAN